MGVGVLGIKGHEFCNSSFVTVAADSYVCCELMEGSGMQQAGGSR